MMTHFAAWRSETVSVCGAIGVRLTTDVRLVDCRRCRKSHRYLDECNDDPPPMPTKPVKLTARELMRQRLDCGPTTSAVLAECANVTSRRVRQLLNEDGATVRVIRGQYVWSAPIGGW